MTITETMRIIPGNLQESGEPVQVGQSSNRNRLFPLEDQELPFRHICHKKIGQNGIEQEIRIYLARQLYRSFRDRGQAPQKFRYGLEKVTRTKVVHHNISRWAHRYVLRHFL